MPVPCVPPHILDHFRWMVELQVPEPGLSFMTMPWMQALGSPNEGISLDFTSKTDVDFADLAVTLAKEVRRV